MISTLASRMRPKNLCDVIGQQHLVGENSILTKIVEKRHPFSIILYGNPGCGKTTIANALANDLNIPCRFFNASTGNKKELTPCKFYLCSLYNLLFSIHREPTSLILLLSGPQMDYLL